MDDFGIYNIAGVNQGEDLYFITSMLYVANVVKSIQKIGVSIRMSQNSMMRAPHNESFLQNITAAKNLKSKLSEFQGIIYDKEIIPIVDTQIMDQVCCVAKKMVRSKSFSGHILIKEINSLPRDDFRNLHKVKRYMKFKKYIEFVVFRTSSFGYLILTTIEDCFRKRIAG